MKMKLYLYLLLSIILSLFTSVKGIDCDAPPTLTKLNFFGSNLTENTLHEVGGKLRYSSKFVGGENSYYLTCNASHSDSFSTSISLSLS